MMKKKMVFMGAVLVAIMMVASATNLYMSSEKINVVLNMPKTIAVSTPSLQPAMVKVVEKANVVPIKTNIAKSDVPVFGGEGDDQNPTLITDGGGNLLAMYESEAEAMDFDIGLAISPDGGNTWNPYILTVDGSPSQPRLAFYKEEAAYGTFIGDPVEGYGKEYLLMFPDIRDPEAGDGWQFAYIDWGSYDIGVPFTSADVACYNTPNPPTPAFWGIIGLTGDNAYSGYEEDNTFLFSYETEQDYFTIIFFYNMDNDVYNMSTAIDQSNGEFYMVADFVNETDPSIYGTYILISPKITSNEDWWQGSWPGILFYNCTHPDVAAVNGKVYITAEVKMNDGSKDIVCWVSDNPALASSWEMYTITETPGESEEYPVISAVDETNALVMFVKDGGVYMSQTKDGGATWSAPEQVNDGNAAVAQYGCMDIAFPYGIWTDNRNGNYDIFMDVVGLSPSYEVNVKGGFGVTATVTNTGNAAGENIPWSIDVSGGVVFLNGHKEGTIPSLEPGQSASIRSLPIGIGKVTVTVQVGGVIKTGSGFLLGPLLLGYK